MQERPNHINDLIIASILGILPEDKRSELNSWVNKSPENRRILDQMQDKAYLKTQLEVFKGLTPEELKAERDSLILKLNIQAEGATWWAPWVMRWKYAAVAAFFILVSGIYIFSFFKTSKKEIVSVPSPISKSYHWNGPFKATLQLADGSTIVLDETRKGILAQQGNTIIKAEEKQLIYQANQTKQLQTVLYNSIITPPGGQIHLVLPDGSNVWLNASSSIHFPIAFTGNDRKVTIIGEAYFEIATIQQSGHKMPFRVNINNKTEVEVLGTVFNINAYSEEPLLKTTLLEGRIKITDTDSSLLIKPNQQVQIEHPAGKPSRFQIVDKPDIDKTMAWRKGKFIFIDDDITTVGMELKRWYNIEIKGNTNERFNSKISRELPIDSCLSILFKGVVRYEKTGNKVYINP